MFDNARLKELERLSNSIEGLLAVCQADTEKIKRESQLEVASKVQKIFDCLKQYHSMFIKYRPYMQRTEFRYKDNLYLGVLFNYEYYAIWVTEYYYSDYSDGHGAIRVQKFKVCEHPKLTNKLMNNEVFVDFVNNWDKYFPTFEDSFISEINKAIQKKIKMTTENRNKELQILNSIKNVEC